MKYDVCGIGNALVDMEFSVSDEFITSHGIEKAGMTLVDEARQTELMTALGGNMLRDNVVVLLQIQLSLFHNLVEILFTNSKLLMMKVGSSTLLI